ncbi:MAG TPA: hypothetical protein VMR88_03255, partial [Candidatus Polarisedimenticolaceae bacterium]|nr:hypothetical protein [Candidatus Polarisedimenticolaceae bacterium]
VARYLLPILYPQGLTRRTQIVLGALVLAVNVVIYGWVFGKRKVQRFNRSTVQRSRETQIRSRWF